MFSAAKTTESVSCLYAAGEHLLSAVLEGMLGAPTDSWKLQPLQQHSTTMSFVSVDVMVPSLTAEQLAQAEEQCNAHIRAARSVRQVVVDEGDEVQREALIAKDIFTGSWPSGPAMHVSSLLGCGGCPACFASVYYGMCNIKRS